MWSRKTTDPLGKLLFEKYSIHMLSRPRENVSVFDVFAVRDDQTFQSGGIDSFLRSKFDKPEVLENEALLDIDATFSDGVSGNVGLSFLQGFLAMLGAGVMNGVSGALEKSKSRTLRFRFGGSTRDYVKDGFELEWKLGEHPFVRSDSAMKEDYRYYIASGVHHCKELTFEVFDENMVKIDASADVVALGGAKAGLAANKDRQITATSNKTLAYGVELNEIVYDEDRFRLGLQESKNYVHVMAKEAALPRATVGGPEDLMILKIVD